MNKVIRSIVGCRAADRAVWSHARMRAAAVAAVGACAAAVAPAAAASGSDIVVTARSERPFEAPPVADKALARMRGGVLLSNGVSIAIGIDILTVVDKLVAVHTIYETDGPDAGLRVFTGGTPPSTVPPGTVTVTNDPGDPASVTVSRSPTGTTVDLSSPQMPAKINLSSEPSSTRPAVVGEMQVPVAANGPPVATTAGDISLATGDRGAVVTLQTPTLLVQQIVGQANGLIVSNTANDRIIDTVSSLNLDVHGINPELAAGLSLGDQLALAVATNR